MSRTRSLVDFLLCLDDEHISIPPHAQQQQSEDESFLHSFISKELVNLNLNAGECPRNVLMLVCDVATQKVVCCNRKYSNLCGWFRSKHIYTSKDQAICTACCMWLFSHNGVHTHISYTSLIFFDGCHPGTQTLRAPFQHFQGAVSNLMLRGNPVAAGQLSWRPACRW